MRTQDEYNVTKQKVRDMYITIDLLNYQFEKVDEISGVVIGSPSFSINADSDLRRSLSISLIPTDSSFDIKQGNKIWMDKYVRPFVNIKKEGTNEYIKTNLGTYMINNPETVINLTDRTINLNCIDLMAKMTGLRNGNLEGVPYIISQGANVRDVMIQLVTLAGFNNYVIQECTYDVPNEIKIDVGGTVFDVIKKLVEIDPNYQVYFDVDGVFHYDKIPTGKNQQALITDDLWNVVIKNYTVSTDYESVKNVIEVVGGTHDVSNFASDVTIDDSTYNLQILSVAGLTDGLKVGFVAKEPVINPYLNINDLGAKPMKNEDGTFPVMYDEEDVYYVARYSSKLGYFVYLGKVTPYGYMEDDNPESPFYVEGTLGRIRIVLSGGEYDDIQSDELAYQRAKYEFYRRCRLQDTITLTCVPIYWIDVNILITITVDGELKKYLVKSVNTGLDIAGTQSITLMTYYDESVDTRTLEDSEDNRITEDEIVRITEGE